MYQNGLQNIEIATMFEMSDDLENARLECLKCGWEDGYRKITTIMDEMTTEINRREENGLA